MLVFVFFVILLSCAATAAHHLGQRLPAIRIGNLGPAKVLVQIQDNLEGVAAPGKRRRVEGPALGHGGHDVAHASHRLLLLAAGHGQQRLQDFVGGEGEAELGRRPEDSSRAALEEGREALLLPDGRRGVPETRVRRLALAGLHLQARLDDVARRGEVGRRHAGNGARRQELQDAQLVGWCLAEKVLLQVAVRGEVDG